MSILGRITRHLRRGTLADGLLQRAGLLPEHVRVRWYGARSRAQTLRTLVKWAGFRLDTAPAGAWALSLGDGDAFQQELDRKLKAQGLAFRSATLEQAGQWRAKECRGAVVVLVAYEDARRLTLAARLLAQHPQLGEVSVEYVPGRDGERSMFLRRDEYADTFFISPVLLDNPSPYAIYEESLRLFEQKCGLRDFLDLYQLLKAVVGSGVPGDIAEFGSYKGHSGWLIARTLAALGSDKRLYMFDTFEAFPAESVGVDHFWSRTHEVDFAEVQGKFKKLPQVTLVKGDFTHTLDPSALGAVALAYIDCDSYRATRFLFDQLWDAKLSPGGLLVCEDYGHPALLGNRAAVHESLEQRPGAFHFFSQFSGFHICQKPLRLRPEATTPP